MTGSWQCLLSVQAGGRKIRAQPSQKDPGGAGGRQAERELAVCLHSPESQQYPGLCQKMHGKQVQGGDLDPLVFTGEGSPGVLHPDVETSGQERYRPVGVIFMVCFLTIKVVRH